MTHFKIKKLVYFPLILILISGCFTYKYSDRYSKEVMSSKGNDISVLRYKINDRTIRYVKATGNVKSETALLFIHGSPGSSSDFKAYLENPELVEKSDVYAVDRPGYGYSNWGKVKTSIYAQCLLLSPLLDSLNHQYKKVIIIGHSYGGPLAAALPLMYADKVYKALLIAPALDPKLEKIFWFSPLGKKAPARWFAPKALQMAADEKYEHADALIELWDKVKGNEFNGEVIHMHGTSDNIVTYENVNFSKKLFSKLKIKTIKDGNHYIPFNKLDEVLILLHQMIEE